MCKLVLYSGRWETENTCAEETPLPVHADSALQSPSYFHTGPLLRGNCQMSACFKFSFFLFFFSFLVFSFFFFFLIWHGVHQWKFEFAFLTVLPLYPSGIYAWDWLMFSEWVPLKFVTWTNSQHSPFCWWHVSEWDRMKGAGKTIWIQVFSLKYWQ